MAVLGKTVKDVYDAMLTTYQTCKDKKQGAENALTIYERTLEFIEETRKILVDLDDFVEILQESLNEQKSNSKAKKTQIKTKGSLVSKLVPCGKECNGCPHGPYLYRVSRVNGKQVWQYLGHAN
jgi:hypothetical protein